MRPLKFRAWNKKLSKMGEVLNLGRGEIIVANGKPEEMGGIPCFNESDSEDYELMQYTGLKDKNGKEIYEGDIVKCFYPMEVKIMEVIFNQETVSFEFKGEEVYDSLVNAGNYEVIGDIYENPELVKDGVGKS